MSDVAIEQQPEAAPVDAGVSQLVDNSVNNAPAAEPDLDALLAQFDQGTKQPEPEAGPIGSQEPNAAPDTPVQESELDQLLAGLNADGERADKLSAELNDLKWQEHQRQDREAFAQFTDDLQGRLPDWCDPDHARNALLAMAAQNPALVASWEVRNVPPSERAKAPAQLQQLQHLYNQVMQNPSDDPRRQSTLDFIRRRAAYLEAVWNGPATLRHAVREIERKAHERVIIDKEATADRAMVAQAVRDSGRRLAPEPPIAWGQLDNHEYRREVKSRYGYDPGT